MCTSSICLDFNSHQWVDLCESNFTPLYASSTQQRGAVACMVAGAYQDQQGPDPSQRSRIDKKKAAAKNKIMKKDGEEESSSRDDLICRLTEKKEKGLTSLQEPRQRLGYKRQIDRSMVKRAS
jgi:hypothetical protein